MVSDFAHALAEVLLHARLRAHVEHGVAGLERVELLAPALASGVVERRALASV